MSDTLHYIDSYFKGEFSAEEVKQFEQKIVEDPAFAEELAFYVSSVQVLKNESSADRKKEFRKLYDSSKTKTKREPVPLWQYISAAALVAGIAFAVFLFYPSDAPDKVADRYIRNNLSGFSLLMGREQDELQNAIELYNQGKLNPALDGFLKVLSTDPSQPKAREYAGVVYLRKGEYDKALVYFRELAGNGRLHANPGKFYTALTLLKRNAAGDVSQAMNLLREVIDQKMDHDEAAKELLEQL